MWTLSLNNALTAPPGFDETRVFFPIEGDRIATYNIRTGVGLWMVTAKPRFEPAAGGDLVFLTEPEALTALHANDGRTAWHVPLADTPAVRPVWDNGWLIVALTTGDILAYRATDGSLIWRVALGSPAHGVPALSADCVYVPTKDGRLVALRVRDGNVVWEKRLGAPAGDAFALTERIYVGSENNFLNCLLAKDGTVDWRWRTGGDIVGAPTVVEDRVYFVAYDNVLRALHVKSGTQQWMRPLPIRPAWGPVIAGSTIVVAGFSPSIRGFALKDGAPAGEVSPPSELAARPHAVEDPMTKAPLLLVTMRDIAKGATAGLAGRSFEPTIAPIGPLPNMIMIAPPTTGSPPRP